jgi:hypothetical protein
MTEKALKWRGCVSDHAGAINMRVLKLFCPECKSPQSFAGQCLRMSNSVTCIALVQTLSVAIATS